MKDELLSFCHFICTKHFKMNRAWSSQPQTNAQPFFFCGHLWAQDLIELHSVLVCDCQQQLLAADSKRFSSNWDDWQQTFTEAKYFSCQLGGRKSRLPVILIHWFYVPAHHGDWAETAALRQNHQSAWIGSSLAKSDINRWTFSVCPVNAYILKSTTHQSVFYRMRKCLNRILYITQTLSREGFQQEKSRSHKLEPFGVNARTSLENEDGNAWNLSARHLSLYAVRTPYLV